MITVKTNKGTLHRERVAMISLLKNFGFLKIAFSASNCCNTSLNFSSISKQIKPDVFERAKATTALLSSSSASYASHFKARDRSELLKTVAKVDEGLPEESVVSLDAIISSREDMFTDERTPNLLFGGIPFRELPIIHLKVTKNNTKATLTDHKGKLIWVRSAGLEGFKHCRKGTNVAGQATGLSISAKAKRLGITDVRIKIQGLGPGRMASIKGIQMGGLNIISLTDDTRIAFKLTHRPRKVRRL